jgi:hypothetical protein
LSTDRFDNANSAYSFDGIDDYMNCGNGIVFNEEITISMWFSATPQNKTTFLIEKYHWDSPWESGVHIVVNSDSQIAFAGRNGTNYYISTLSQPLSLVNNWINVISIIRNNNWELWINGVFVDLYNYKEGNFNNEDDLIIGNWFNGDENKERNFNGKIDDIRIYNRALVEGEIQALYHEGGWGK